MKGIAHFSVGVAVASCFPAAVRAAMAGDPRYFLLGGVMGLLPDTLDFRLVRFLQTVDVDIVPDPLTPDARAIADGIADAFSRAAARGCGLRVKLAAVQTGPQTWQQYDIVFDVRQQQVRVSLGPVVTTGGEVVSRPRHGARAAATAPLPCPVRLAYTASITVAAFDGPSFLLSPSDDAGMLVQFIPWHRRWTHSLVTCAALGSGLALLAGPLAGLVAFLAGAAHALVDQLGYLGGALLYPLVPRRLPGCRLVRSGSRLGNATCVWMAVLLTFRNLAAQSGFRADVTLVQAVALGIGLPLAARFAMRHPLPAHDQ